MDGEGGKRGGVRMYVRSYSMAVADRLSVPSMRSSTVQCQPPVRVWLERCDFEESATVRALVGGANGVDAARAAFLCVCVRME